VVRIFDTVLVLCTRTNAATGGPRRTGSSRPNSRSGHPTNRSRSTRGGRVSKHESRPTYYATSSQRQSLFASQWDQPSAGGDSWSQSSMPSEFSAAQDAMYHMPHKHLPGPGAASGPLLMPAQCLAAPSSMAMTQANLGPLMPQQRNNGDLSPYISPGDPPGLPPAHPAPTAGNPCSPLALQRHMSPHSTPAAVYRAVYQPHPGGGLFGDGRQQGTFYLSTNPSVLHLPQFPYQPT
jgi:hypothetical protein